MWPEALGVFVTLVMFFTLLLLWIDELLAS